MPLTKTARFPGRVEARRKSALLRREINIKQLNARSSTTKLPESEVAEVIVKLDRANTDIANLKKKLRIS